MSRDLAVQQALAEYEHWASVARRYNPELDTTRMFLLELARRGCIVVDAADWASLLRRSSWAGTVGEGWCAHGVRYDPDWHCFLCGGG